MYLLVIIMAINITIKMEVCHENKILMKLISRECREYSVRHQKSKNLSLGLPSGT